MVVILLSFLCHYDNLTLKLHLEKRSYPDEKWIFIDRFKAENQECVLLLKHLKKASKSTMSMI